MQIVYHVGAYGRDDDRLIRTLRRNRDALWKLGTEIPAPTRCPGIFSEAIKSFTHSDAPAELQEVVLDMLTDNEHAERVILGQRPFLSLPQRILTPMGLYADAPSRLPGLSNLFADSIVEFFLPVVHPARQVAALVAQSKGGYGSLMNGVDPRHLRWAPAVRAMLQAVPDRDFVIWAQEDLPFIWPEVLRRLAGVGPDTALQGEDAVLAELLTPEALRDLQSDIDATPGISIRARRDLVEQALATSTRADAMQGDIALPGWSQTLIDQLSDIYAEDLSELAAISGVEFISA